MRYTETQKALLERYPLGTRIMLIHMDDPYTSLLPGDKGTITGLDDLGTLQMVWESGSTLGLIPGVDVFEILKPTGKAIFVRKVASLSDLKEEVGKGGRPEPYVIEKQVELEKPEYKAFSENLLSDYDFIKQNVFLMHRDINGIYHCLLVKAKGSGGGILCECEGYSYSRYSGIYEE